ncbi:phosphatase PAP2 family protein [uncultured Brevibacillus sp.]|uniref:phosphatase PAP2 family protein n=1 Tax=uncultured Brevibacillus sp. TaxID=169970 RepID=UPI0025981CB8|nr:phosphatase PAP2 family protein [uncultured Brevibacillus sp.]
MNHSRLSTKTKQYALVCMLVIAVSLFLFGKLGQEMLEQELTAFDSYVIEKVQSLITPKLTSVMQVFTALASTWSLVTLAAISIVIMLWQHKRWEALFLLLALGGGVGFNLLLKWLYRRERPSIHRLVEESGYSFPSGHSMAAFIFFGMMAMLLTLFVVSRAVKIVILLAAVVLILLVGISRIYLGVHYPSDVLAGFTAGGVWLVMCLLGLKIVVETRR